MVITMGCGGGCYMVNYEGKTNLKKCQLNRIHKKEPVRGKMFQAGGGGSGQDALGGETC